MSEWDKCVLTAIIVALIWSAWREFAVHWDDDDND